MWKATTIPALVLACAYACGTCHVAEVVEVTVIIDTSVGSVVPEAQTRFQVDAASAVQEWKDRSGGTFEPTVVYRNGNMPSLSANTFTVSSGNIEQTESDRYMIGNTTTNPMVTDGATIIIDNGIVGSDQVYTVMLHELGHALGLRFAGTEPCHYQGHDSSVMRAVSGPSSPPPQHLQCPEVVAYCFDHGCDPQCSVGFSP